MDGILSEKIASQRQEILVEQRQLSFVGDVETITFIYTYMICTNKLFIQIEL